MRKQHLWQVMLVLSVLLAGSGWAGPSMSLVLEARSAAFRADRWLVANQGEDGSWAGDERLTARAVAALAGSGYGTSKQVEPCITKALAWLATKQVSEAAPQKPGEWERRSDRAAALAAAESASNELPASQVAWRTTVLEQALATQRGNGCWQEQGKDSVSATIHALLVLGLAGGDALRQAP